MWELGPKMPACRIVAFGFATVPFRNHVQNFLTWYVESFWKCTKYKSIIYLSYLFLEQVIYECILPACGWICSVFRHTRLSIHYVQGHGTRIPMHGKAANSVHKRNHLAHGASIMSQTISHATNIYQPYFEPNC